ncbi:MAG TPA: RNA polymerase sigma factor, partial [Candidatus Polarisedimenticolia bacterium]|nr:RNA polymerase sigma factor [Candidatus Polarisedimenticolia bacterium]
WLYRILTNVCLDEIRRRRARPVEDGVSGREPADRRAADRAAERLDVARALQRVPNEARALLVLRYADGLSYGELARVRGITVNTVKSQLKRGKEILKAALVERPRRRHEGGRG